MIVDTERSLARFGSAAGTRVAVLCTMCGYEGDELTVMAARAPCPECGVTERQGGEFPTPEITPEFAESCVRRLYGRFAAAEKASVLHRPRDQNLLRWLGYTSEDLAQHVSRSFTFGCYYCHREIIGFFHVAHVEPISGLQHGGVIELWECFQLRNIAPAHAECNLHNGTKGPTRWPND